MDCSDDYLPGTPQREIAIRRRVHRLAEFYRHLLAYGIVIGMLFAFNAFFVLSSDKPASWSSWWAFLPAFGWGIGLFFHAITVLPMWNLFSQDWEERKVKELMERGRQ